LSAKNLIEPDVEHLELEELPGATGLRAMRITLHKDSKGIISAKEDLIKNINEALSLQ
jgi:hypothetical protein